MVINSMYNLVTAICIGILLVIQTGINNTLRGYLQSPILTALFSVFISTLSLLILLILNPLPDVKLKDIYMNNPLWIWTGGILGAFIVLGYINTAPKLGAYYLVILVIFGQVLSSLLIDHMGILGYQQNPINIYKIIGALLILLGISIAMHK